MSQSGLFGVLSLQSFWKRWLLFCPRPQAVCQSPYYKTVLNDIRRSAVAMAASKSELDAVTEAFSRDNVDLETLQTCLRKLPAWLESLRTSTVQRLVDNVNRSCKTWLDRQEAQLGAWEDAGEMQEVMISSLREYCQALNGARPLMHRIPDLGPQLLRGQELLKTAEEARRTSALRKALLPFVSAGQVSVQEETALMKALGDEKLSLAHVTAGAGRDLAKAYTHIAMRLAEETALPSMQAARMEELIAMLACLSKMQRFLSDVQGKALREVLLEVLQAPMQLQQLLLKHVDEDGSPTMPSSDSDGDAFSTVVHLKSLLARGEQPLAATPDDPEKIAEGVRADAMVVVEKARGFLEFLKENMVGKAEKKLTERVKEGIKHFGEYKEVVHHGCGRWAWKLKAGTGFPELVKVGEKSLLKEGHAELVASFVQKCKEETRCDSCPTIECHLSTNFPCGHGPFFCSETLSKVVHFGSVFLSVAA